MERSGTDRIADAIFRATEDGWVDLGGLEGLDRIAEAIREHAQAIYTLAEVIAQALNREE